MASAQPIGSTGVLAQTFIADKGAAYLGGTIGATLSPKTPVKLTRGEGVDGDSRPAWGK